MHWLIMSTSLNGSQPWEWHIPASRPHFLYQKARPAGNRIPASRPCLLSGSESLKNTCMRLPLRTSETLSSSLLSSGGALR